MARDPLQLNTSNIPLELYNGLRKWFTIVSLLMMPVLFFINAPFGRFAPSTSTPSSLSPISWFNSPAFMFDGIYSWILMELVSPASFIYAFLKSPLTFYTPPLPRLGSPQTLLVALYFVHYANRALISPLRTPSRSKSHLIVPLSAIGFNLANGYILGSYFSSPFARIYLGGDDVYQRRSFWIGISMWLVGFVGNVAHDEILLNIRRRAKERREKDAEEEEKEGKEKDDKSKKGSKSRPKEQGEYYGIPQGLLYAYISYPNYFCEWIEWLGFAIAASPVPLPFDGSPTGSPLEFLSALGSLFLSFLSPATWVQIFNEPAYAFAPNLSPPWIFLFNEIVLMVPRAYKGHLWYRQRFGESYPKDRKAVIPFIL